MSEEKSGSGNAYLALRIKHARLAAGLTLKKLADEASCSESLISKIERASAMPSLATLHRLARALNTNIAQLITEEELPQSPILRADQRTSLSSNGIRLERLVHSERNGLLQGNIHIVEPGCASDGEIEHVGEEVGYILEGQMELLLDGKTYLLGMGDSFHFPSRLKHAYRNPGNTRLKIIWINTPATF